MADRAPGISQVKSAVQCLTGDFEGAWETQRNFCRGCPLMTGPTALVYAARRKPDEAKATLREGWHACGDIINCVPIVGHAKAVVYHAVGNNQGASRALEGANRMTVVIAGGFVAGPIGAMVAGVACDGAHQLRDGKSRGVIGSVQAFCEAEEKYKAVGHLVDAGAALLGDAMVGAQIKRLRNSNPTPEPSQSVPKPDGPVPVPATTDGPVPVAAPDGPVPAPAAPDGPVPRPHRVGHGRHRHHRPVRSDGHVPVSARPSAPVSATPHGHVPVPIVPEGAVPASARPNARPDGPRFGPGRNRHRTPVPAGPDRPIPVPSRPDGAVPAPVRPGGPVPRPHRGIRPDVPATDGAVPAPPRPDARPHRHRTAAARPDGAVPAPVRPDGPGPFPHRVPGKSRNWARPDGVAPVPAGPDVPAEGAAPAPTRPQRPGPGRNRNGRPRPDSTVPVDADGSVPVKPPIPAPVADGPVPIPGADGPALVPDIDGPVPIPTPDLDEGGGQQPKSQTPVGSVHSTPRVNLPEWKENAHPNAQWRPQPVMACDCLLPDVAARGFQNLELFQDGHDTFASMLGSMQKAQRMIVIVGWSVHPLTVLTPPGVPEVQLGQFLVQKAQDLSMLVLVVVWSNPTKVFETYAKLTADYFKPSNVVVIQDWNGIMGSHHQKMVVCDDGDNLTAYAGGLDLSAGRHDGSGHVPHSHLNWHDVHARVDGDLAYELLERVIIRLPGRVSLRVTQELRARAPGTFPVLAGPKVRGQVIVGGDGIKSAYIRAISLANKTIYIENQFFIVKDPENGISVQTALVTALERNPALCVVVILPLFPADYAPHDEIKLSGIVMEQIYYQFKTMTWMYSRLSQHYPHQSPFDRLRFYFLGNVGHRSPGKPEAKPIYVHSKLMIVDQAHAIIGSANLNHRSMEVDTEVVLSMFEHNSHRIADFRNSLVSEHCGLHNFDFDQMVQRANDNWKAYKVCQPLPYKQLLPYPVEWHLGTRELHGLPFPGYGTATARGELKGYLYASGKTHV